MVYHGRRALGPELEDTVYACRRCGAELIRTSVRAASDREKRETAEAA